VIGEFFFLAVGGFVALYAASVAYYFLFVVPIRPKRDGEWW
jgi:hypothetical protein